MGDSQNEMQVLYGQIIGKYRKPRTKWWFLWEKIIYILNGDCRLSCLITAWYPQFRHFYNEKTNHWIWGYLSGKPKWLRTSNISAIEISAIVCCTALSSPLPKVKERRDTQSKIHSSVFSFTICFWNARMILMDNLRSQPWIWHLVMEADCFSPHSAFLTTICDLCHWFPPGGLLLRGWRRELDPDGWRLRVR
jgi:hypothetical protein